MAMAGTIEKGEMGKGMALKGGKGGSGTQKRMTLKQVNGWKRL